MDEIAYCGLQCDTCPIRVATIKNDDAMRAELLATYFADHPEVTLANINCEGCHALASVDNVFCGACEIRACAVTKGIVTCADCDEYPCDIMEKFFPADSDNRKLLDGLRAG